MMKKITLFLAFLITSIGFSQELVTNGDFETGTAAPWFGNAANVVDDGGGNYVNQANVETATPIQPFLTNLSQIIVLESGKTYQLSFDAYTDVSTGSRTMIAGLGQNGGSYLNEQATPVLTSTLQSFSYEFDINYGEAQDDRVFFDMAAEAGYVFIDNVSVIEIVNLCNDGILNNGETEIDCGGPNCSACPSPPATAAQIQPARAAADVVSVFSDEYTNVTPSGVETFGGATYTNFTVENFEDTRRLTVTANGEGMQYLYLSSAPLDLTSFTTMHIDFYVEGAVAVGQELQVFLFNFGAWPNGAGSTKLFENFDVNTIGSGAWYTADLALDSFNDTPLSRDKISLVQIVVNGPAGGTPFGPVYIDNIYFHKNTTLGIEDFDKTSFSAYPNPTQDSWTVKTNNVEIKSVTLYNILGKEVMTLNPNSTDVKIDATRLSNGLYFAKIATDNGSSSLKLIKN